ncbi:DNA-binding barrel domain superfamily [Sesbania bispinosa]|nr:DNA-binding barrel domain superfamily [Sesbania bispinosa]
MEKSASLNSSTNALRDDHDMIGVPFMASWLPYRSSIIIAEKLISSFQTELPKEVTLRDPVGNEFSVSIEELSNMHCFTKGLPQMRAFYPVHYPVHMWYRYVGNATFSFELWPKDGEGQIDYPNPALKKEDHEQCVNQPGTTSNSDHEDVSSEADEIMGVRSEDLWTTTLTQAQVEGRRAVVISARVVTSYFHNRPNNFQVRLPDDHIKSWELIWNRRIPTECKIGHGWSEFCTTHGLQKGDHIRFWKLENEAFIRIVRTRSST